jgi:hypothetical protein
MPTQRDVQERQYWWCPKWYWPFAVCSGIRTQHKWCYNFSWVKETRYGFVMHLEGCENGKLFTWTKAGLGVGSTTYPGGEMCFDSSLGPDEGRCDSSRTGLQASGLSASDPYASDLDWDVFALNSSAAERGTFDFTGENERLCQKGLWPWTRTLHEQAIIASVVTRFATIQWYLGGIAVTGNSGTISMSATSTWPFPLPKGRSQTHAVKVKYIVTTEANKNTLKVLNDPVDGSYSFSISMSALDNGRVFKSSNTFANFRGETCDFEPEKVSELAKCIHQFSSVSNDKAKSRVPKPGEPIIVVSDGIWEYVAVERIETVKILLEIITNTLNDDPQLYSQAIEQLEQELGGVSAFRFLSVDPGKAAPAENLAGQPCSFCSKVPVAATLTALGIGLVIGRLGRTQMRR